MRLNIAACVLGLLVTLPGAVQAVPSDDEIQKILVNRIDVEKQSIGIVVGVVEPTGRRIVAYGNMGKNDPRKVDGDTLFEIGSITKVFTALVAAEMADKGEIKLDDPIAKYLPPNAKVPERDGKQITFIDLATHTSGLPRMPANFKPKDPENPYVDYTIDQLYAFLGSYELPRPIGAKYEYSNLAFGLLGHVLSLKANQSYENLLIARVLDPLGLNSTRLTLSPELSKRFADGHHSDLVTATHWDLPDPLAGAGGLRSSAKDLTIFLSAAMGLTETPLSKPFKMLRASPRATDIPFRSVGLGWEIDTRGGGELITKGGGTAGFSTFIAYDPGKQTGIVVLSNTAQGVGDIADHLLDARYPLTVPAGSPKVAAIEVKTRDSYPGRYRMSAASVLTITRDGEQYFVQLTGQPRFAIFPKGEGQFFLKVVDAQLSFDPPGDTGASSVVTLHQNGRDRKCNRISDAEAVRVEETVVKRFKDQIAYADGEAVVRRMVDQLSRKEIDYTQLADDFVELVRTQATRFESLIADMGALKSVSFKGVGPGGFDIYDVVFDNGRIDWRIFLDIDGKLGGASIRKIN